MGYTARNVVKDKTPVSIGASATDSVVTGTEAQGEFFIPVDFANGICIDIVCTAFTVGAGITAKLQVKYNKAQAWQDSKTVSIIAVGTTSLRLLSTVSGDQAFLPLKSLGRLVISTGASSAITVNEVLIPSIS